MDELFVLAAMLVVFCFNSNGVLVTLLATFLALMLMSFALWRKNALAGYLGGGGVITLVSLADLLRMGVEAGEVGFVGLSLAAGILAYPLRLLFFLLLAGGLRAIWQASQAYFHAPGEALGLVERLAYFFLLFMLLLILVGGSAGAVLYFSNPYIATQKPGWYSIGSPRGGVAHMVGLNVAMIEVQDASEQAYISFLSCHSNPYYGTCWQPVSNPLSYYDTYDNDCVGIFPDPTLPPNTIQAIWVLQCFPLQHYLIVAALADEQVWIWRQSIDFIALGVRNAALLGAAALAFWLAALIFALLVRLALRQESWAAKRRKQDRATGELPTSG